MEQVGDVEAALGAVEFRQSGEAVKGEYHCSSCGYGVAIYRTLPQCPMCGGTSWEPAAWSPFARARDTVPAAR
jgi:rubrerythrin